MARDEIRVVDVDILLLLRDEAVVATSPGLDVAADVAAVDTESKIILEEVPVIADMSLEIAE